MPFQALFPEQSGQPSPWERFKDTYLQAAIHSPLGGGGLARAFYKAKGYSDDQINQAIKALDVDNAKKYKDAPVVQHVRKGHPLDYVSPDNIGRGAVSLLAHVLGGVDPTFAIAPGASALERIPAQAAVQGVSSAARQKVNVNTKMQDKIDPKQVLTDMALGAVFQTGMEGISQVGKFAKNVIHDEDITYPAHDAPLASDGLPGNGHVRPMDPHEIARIMDDPQAVGDPAPQRRMNNRDIPDIQDEDLGLTQADQPSVPDQATANGRLSPDTELTDADLAHNDVVAFDPRNAANPDASVDVIPTDSSHEKFTPHIEEPATPANDATRGEAIKGFVKNILTDERGSLNGPDETPQSPGGLFRETKRDPEGNIHLEYQPSVDQAPIPIKMGIDNGTAEMAIDQFSTLANRLGPVKVRDAMHDLMGMYPEIKSFGGFRRSGANAGRVQEITPIKSLLSDERGSVTPGGEEPPMEEPQSAIEKLTQEIQNARPIRGKQSKLYSEELSKRVGQIAQVRQHTSGLEGLHAELGQLKGAMPKIDFQGIADNFSPEEVNSLLDTIKNHPRLTFFDSINARKGLLKLMQGQIPTKSELSLLSDVFPPEAMDAIHAKQPLKAVDIMANLIGIPRALKATLDLSAPLRQGAPLIHTKEYWKSFGAMFKQAFSEKHYQATQNEIFARPSYPMMKEAGLAVTRAGKNLNDREEQFMSNWAEQIPAVGHIVRASDRGYTGFLNKLRADTFDNLTKEAQEAGIDFAHDPKALHDIASFINNATGRGDLGKIGTLDLNQMSPILSASFFSPRLMAARFNMLNPNYYVKLSPFARKQAVKSLLAYSSVVMTTLGLAKLAGADVETDPRSTDFAKIRTGNTRYDVTAGFQPYIRTGAQLVTGQKVSSDGKVTNIGTGIDGKSLMHGEIKTHGVDKGYKQDTRLDVVGRFFANKEAPVPAFVSNLLRQHDQGGNPITVSSETANLFVPMITQDVYDAVQDRGAKGLMIIPPDLFGVGVNTYAPKQAKSNKSNGFSSDFSKSFSKSDFKGGF